MNLNQITLPALDVEKSIDFYQNLGLKLIVRSLPKYARFESPEGDVTLSLHVVEEGHTTHSAIIYFECMDLDLRIQELKNKGFVFVEEAVDQPWLWREAKLKDPYGNVIILYFAGGNRKFPPWRIMDI